MGSRIETTTNRWFEETVSRANDNANLDTTADNLLSGIVPVAYNYCNAVFVLANANHRLPAMALLRILAELALKTIWCMYEDNPKNESHDVRILRWVKETNNEEIKLLKKVLPSADPGDTADIQRTIDYLQSEIDKNPHPSMGPFFNSLDELPSEYKKNIYPVLYVPFNRAIHPNLKLFSDLIRQEGNNRTFLPDLEVDVQALKIYSMTAAFNILSIVRLYYEWDYKGMKSEYIAIKKEFAATEK
jgi:hypothetical protein